MKFRLLSSQDVDEGTGETPDPFAGTIMVLVWSGRTFQHIGLVEGQTGFHVFREVLGQALDHHQVTQPAKECVRWTSPTAIGRQLAAAGIDPVRAETQGYEAQTLDNGRTAQLRRRGEP